MTITRHPAAARAWTLVLLLVCGAPLAAGAGRPAHEPSPEALVAEIPFHPDTPTSRVMIDLAEEGSAPFALTLDTGASGSVLTPRAARALGVTVRRIRSSPYRHATRLGRDLQFWVDVSSSDTAGGAGGEYGLLGADFLDDYVLEIDYPGRTVRFYDPRQFAVPETVDRPDERVLHFRRNGTRILVELEVEGTTLVTLLDTGAPAVVLAGPEATKAGIDWHDLPELEGVGGVLGPIRTHTYVAERVRFAGFEFPDQPIAIAPRGGYNQGGPSDSALGYDVLKDFVMRIDYPRRRIWLRRRPERVTTYWGLADGSPFLAGRDEPARDEIAEQDAEAAARWEAEKDSRVYAETSDGHFVVVDGYRLRRGPQEGEVWYTHEEMLALKKEREREDRDEP